jgi:hypothetical protein
MEPGRFVIYDVVEITHDKALEKHDTILYQLKTIWGEPYHDNQGRDGFEFIRYRRENNSGNWEFSDKWHGLIDGARAELVVENQRKVKLYFAPSLFKNWDENAQNLLGEENKYYRKVHFDTLINGIPMDSTVIVESELNQSAIDSLRSYEVYAKQIGLVYKHLKDNHHQLLAPNSNGGIQVDPEVNLGRELYMTYVSSGVE